MSLKKSSGAQSEDLGPSLTIQFFYQKNIPGFMYVLCVFFRFILDFNGRTSRGHTGRR